MKDSTTLLKENINNLVDVLTPFYRDLKEAKGILDIKGKRLQQALYEQASWLSYYDQKRAEIEKIYNFFDAYYVSSLKGEFWKLYTEKVSLDLNTKDKEMYINNEAKYVERKELLIEIKEILDNYKSIVNAFEGRGYVLKHLTDIHVNSLQDVVI